ncbi:MAG: hypothetical protein KME30_29975 [Iphinoe sp. HA4291-MV1]|jgi:hypothetical protein|nr:hypothetical protein [Iphinoe sp. HA4291-MV1]
MPNILFEKCPKCNNSNFIESILPPGNIHHGKLSCDSCGKFVKWLPKPKMTEISIMRLLQNPNLEEWECRFLKMLSYRLPTKAEVIVLEAIQARINPVFEGRGTG